MACKHLIPNSPPTSHAQDLGFRVKSRLHIGVVTPFVPRALPHAAMGGGRVLHGLLSAWIPGYRGCCAALRAPLTHLLRGASCGTPLDQVLGAVQAGQRPYLSDTELRALLGCVLQQGASLQHDGIVHG